MTEYICSFAGCRSGANKGRSRCSWKKFQNKQKQGRSYRRFSGWATDASTPSRRNATFCKRDRITPATVGWFCWIYFKALLSSSPISFPHGMSLREKSWTTSLFFLKPSLSVTALTRLRRLWYISESDISLSIFLQKWVFWKGRSFYLVSVHVSLHREGEQAEVGFSRFRISHLARHQN